MLSPFLRVFSSHNTAFIHLKLCIALLLCYTARMPEFPDYYAILVVLLFTGVILLEPYAPSLTMGVMYSFVLLSLTTTWVIISVFRRDPAQSIQISRTPRK